MRLLLIICLIVYILGLLDKIEVLETEYINLQIECNKRATSSF